MSDHAVIEKLVDDARFASQDAVRQRARDTIRSHAQKRGIRCASIFEFYASRGRGGDRTPLTVPAINIRGLSFDFARAILRAALKHHVGAFIIELARSEMEYTDQQPDEIAVVVLAAAVREGYHGPLFLQGDHFKINPGKNEHALSRDVEEIERLVTNALAAGLYNIDIDASTTVDLTKSSIEEQQHRNAELTAHFTRFIREREPFPVSIGGEIGEIGGKTSTVEEFRAFMNLYRKTMGDTQGITKVAVQTGTSHGGVPNPDGSVKEVGVDFDALTSISRVAQHEYGLAGAVQHGASTLPEAMFGRFPEAGAIEIHLATEFQNIVFEHPLFPKELSEEIDAYLKEHFSDERKAGQTDAQFLYKNRKFAWGPFKKTIASLSSNVRNEIAASLEAKVISLFHHFRVINSRSLIDRFIR